MYILLIEFHDGHKHWIDFNVKSGMKNAVRTYLTDDEVCSVKMFEECKEIGLYD